MNHDKDSRYNTVCKDIITEDNIYKVENTELCAKLVKNSVSLSNLKGSVISPFERRRNLNSRLFYQIKPDIFTNDIIKKIFNELKSRASEFYYRENCPYYSYNIFTKESHDIIKLDNFLDNINTIKSTRGKKFHTYHCPCVRYVYNVLKYLKE